VYWEMNRIRMINPVREHVICMNLGRRHDGQHHAFFER
jgi:hypothetical protein